MARRWIYACAMYYIHVHMTTVTVEDPIEVTTKTVGKNGQVYVGRDLAGEDVQLVISEASGD